MSEHELEESLSALMDGELAPDEARRVLDAVLEDPALRARWAAWQRVGAALAGQHPARSGDLAARVQAALESEPRPAVRTSPVAAPVPPVPPAPARPRRGQGARRVLALAASGAAVAVLVAVMATRERAPPAPLAQAPATHGAPPGPLAQAPDVQPAPPEPLPQAPASHGAPADAAASQRMAWDDAGPAVSRRLNAYLLNHNDYLSGGVRGLLAYARVVGYDGDE